MAEVDAMSNDNYIDRTKHAYNYSLWTFATSGMVLLRWLLCYILSSARYTYVTYRNQMTARNMAKEERSRRSHSSSPMKNYSPNKSRSSSNASVIDLINIRPDNITSSSRTASLELTPEITSSSRTGSREISRQITAFNHADLTISGMEDNDSVSGYSDNIADDDDTNSPVIKSSSMVTKEIKDEFIAALTQLRNVDTEFKLKLSLKRILNLLRSHRELCTIETKQILIQVCSRRKQKIQHTGASVESLWTREVGELYGACLREISVLKLLMRDIRGEAQMSSTPVPSLPSSPEHNNTSSIIIPLTINPPTDTTNV